jgi:mRNA-degrading endonuclease RelE of RelBE toxin-antitoxin system
MQSEDIKPFYIRFTPEFKRNLRVLAKKYRHIRTDIQPVINEIESGNFIGDRIPGTKGHIIFKVRVRNTDIRKGKRSGYRFIYYLKTHSEVVLITIYSKNEQSDISSEQIRRILNEYDNKL